MLAALPAAVATVLFWTAAAAGAAVALLIGLLLLIFAASVLGLFARELREIAGETAPPHHWQRALEAERRRRSGA